MDTQVPILQDIVKWNYYCGICKFNFIMIIIMMVMINNIIIFAFLIAAWIELPTDKPSGNVLSCVW